MIRRPNETAAEQAARFDGQVRRDQRFVRRLLFFKKTVTQQRNEAQFVRTRCDAINFQQRTACPCIDFQERNVA